MPLPDHLVNPDGQPPLPFAAAEAYAQKVTAWAPTPPGLRVWRDIAYGAHRLQRFDVYARAPTTTAPAGAGAGTGATAGAAVLVFWHGGGWTNGYRQWAAFMAPAVAARGLVLVAPSYRLAPEHPLPCAFDDALALLAALPAQLPDCGGAADRLLLSGHSAGGHLAMLAALRAADRARAGVAAGAVRGCLPISGIMDLHQPVPLRTPGSLEERVYTTVLRDRGCDGDDDTLCSPLYWAAGNALPVALTVGEHDSPRVLASNRRLAALLRAQPGPLSCVVEPGRDHFSSHTALRDAADGWYDRLAAMAAGACAAGQRP